jgi:shikimate kinase
MDVILVGHRGSGKSTLGAAAAALLGAQHIDLDAHIEAATGLTPAQHIAADMAAFRALEQETLAGLLLQSDELRDELREELRIISPGAGLQALPGWALIVWIWRDGWEDTARDHRARLRPELSWDEEVAWMRATREPRWAEAAHLRLDVSRGRSIPRAARQLADLIRWAAAPNAAARKTWMVPAGPAQLARAARDATLLGLAGVELRSDLIPHAHELPPLPLPTLVSLRTRDDSWLLDTARGAEMIDLDLHTLDADGGLAALDQLAPRPLLLSSHPGHAGPDAWPALLAAAERLAARHPRWAEHLGLKFAPSPASLVELMALFDQQDEEPSPWEVTFLPQGRAFAWTRPWLVAHMNATSYLPVGLAPHRVGGHAAPTPWDLQDWLPHLGGERVPERFDALIGDPVEGSAGDWWHRAAALASDEDERGYVKIPLPDDADDAAWDALFRLLERLAVRGVSVTAPHKQRVLAHRLVGNPSELPAANTLVRSDDGWVAHDTDSVGMSAALHAAEAHVSPGAVAVMGRGGVSPAVLRAIEEAGWRLDQHASAREGWRSGAPVALIVQAAGPQADAATGAPDCAVWLDLHYQGVAAPATGELHMNGDEFFEAQAQAQRALWRARR